MEILKHSYLHNYVQYGMTVIFVRYIYFNFYLLSLLFYHLKMNVLRSLLLDYSYSKYLN